MDAGLILDNLLAPPILFFGLGLLASLLRSDLEMPQAMTRAMSLYLLFAIGLHGGVELRGAGFSSEAVSPLLAGILASMAMSGAVFALLRRKLGTADAAAIGATYGSISAVTFVTACSFLDDREIAWSGSMVAAMALMESPAIIVAVFLARRAGLKAPDGGENGNGLLREALLNGSVFLLLGSLVIGAVVGEQGWEGVAPFAKDPFKGLLCLFLLDMGLIAGRRLGALRSSGALLFGVALLLPPVQGGLGILGAWLMGLSHGDALLFTVLCASASYIAVPAAVRTALPQANASLFLPMSLAVTFPFNIAVGIPSYMLAIQSIWGQT